MVEVSVHPFIPRLVEWCELTMLDEWANAVFAGEPAQFLVLISLIASLHFDELRVAFHHPWRDLHVVFSRCSHMNIENRVSRSIDQ